VLKQGIYKPFGGLEHGRCLGHGAVPVSVSEDIYKPVDKLDKIPESLDVPKLATQGRVYAHGFAMLEPGSDELHATYYQGINGVATPMFSEVIK
jgi:hypothetical protein